jgi:hypothetical protein
MPNNNMTSARASNRVLMTLNFTEYDSRNRPIYHSFLATWDFDAAPGPDQLMVFPVQGFQACFSPDDSKVVHLKSDGRLWVSEIDANGVEGTKVAITSKNGGTNPDWKAAAPTP